MSLPWSEDLRAAILGWVVVLDHHSGPPLCGGVPPIDNRKNHSVVLGPVLQQKFSENVEREHLMVDIVPILEVLSRDDQDSVRLLSVEAAIQLSSKLSQVLFSCSIHFVSD